MKQVLLVLLVFVHFESNAQTQFSPSIGPFTLGDSLQKVIDIIESRSRKEKVYFKIHKPVNPSYIENNFRDYQLKIQLYYTYPKIYKSEFTVLDIWNYYSGELIGTGGLCSNVLELTHYDEIRINDFISFKDLEFRFIDSLLFELKFNLIYLNNSGNENLIIDLLKEKFGYPKIRRNLGEKIYEWNFSTNRLIYDPTYTFRNNIHFYDKDVKEQIASIEKDLIRKQIEELSKETEKGIKEGF